MNNYSIEARRSGAGPPLSPCYVAWRVACLPPRERISIFCELEELAFMLVCVVWCDVRKYYVGNHADPISENDTLFPRYLTMAVFNLAEIRSVLGYVIADISVDVLGLTWNILWVSLGPAFGHCQNWRWRVQHLLWTTGTVGTSQVS
jgi:hypothetical protein